MERTEAEETAIIAITRSGAVLGLRLARELNRRAPRTGIVGAVLEPPLEPTDCTLDHLKASHLYVSSRVAPHVNGNEVDFFDGPVAGLLGKIFPRCRRLVLFIALGAAVRLLAPYVKDKRTDPAVVVVDDSGKYAISALSGHIGGANDLARQVARVLGAEPVITTGSDVLGTIAPDMIGRDLGWTIENEHNLTMAAAAMVNGDLIGLYQDAGERDWRPGSLPDNVQDFDSLDSLAASSCRAALIVTDRLIGPEYGGLLRGAVVYRPRSLVVGIGCNRGASRSEVEQAVLGELGRNTLSFRSIRNLATIDIKSNEDGISEFARLHEIAIKYYTSQELESVPNLPNPSEAIRRIVGARGVCEPAAMLSANTDRLLVQKKRIGNVTVAVARVECSPGDDGEQRYEGSIFVVGLGPGASGQMTVRAREALDASDVILGYKTYLGLIRDFTAGKEVISSGMRQEVARARKAIELAATGRNVAVVSSGDAGVYGMAGLVYEVARASGWDGAGRIEVVPGVSALNAAAALLGAPLMHDFAVISLSDLLTPWEAIVRRIHAAADGNFVLALYNPRSGRRTRQIEEARDILLKHRSGATPVGLVTNAYRSGQNVVVTDLDRMLDHEIGMLTTVVVGNSQTESFNGVMVTPRGYEKKYELGSGD